MLYYRQKKFKTKQQIKITYKPTNGKTTTKTCGSSLNNGNQILLKTKFNNITVAAYLMATLFPKLKKYDISTMVCKYD